MLFLGFFLFFCSGSGLGAKAKFHQATLLIVHIHARPLHCQHDSCLEHFLLLRIGSENNYQHGIVHSSECG